MELRNQISWFLGCEIYISRNKELFHYLRDRQEQVETETREKLEWIDAAVASRIKAKKEVADVFNPVEAQAHFKWLYERAALFQTVFGRYFQEYKRSE